MNDPASQALQSQFVWQNQLPWLTLLVLALPLVLAAWRLKIYPSIWWILVLAISLVTCVISIFNPGFFVVAVTIDLGLVAVAAVDFLRLYLATSQGIEAQREIPRTCSLGVPLESSITIENRTSMTLVGAVRDDLPENFECFPAEHALRLPPLGRLTAKRKLKPGRRGAFKLEYVYLRFASSLRLWVRQLRIDVVNPLNVYPDMKQLADYALLARTNRLSLIGVRKTRRIGQDSEFERLRDYTRDDNHRHIDWRSTARRNKLTVRQFQNDQSQRVIFLLDCG